MGTDDNFPVRWRAIAKAIAKLSSVPIFAALLHGAIFPEHLGTYQRSAPKTIGIPDKELYDEYGLEATESAEYTTLSPEHDEDYLRAQIAHR